MKELFETKPENRIPVVVTTEHKGVFFGYADPADIVAKSKDVRLLQSQMCVYWSVQMKSVVGLANTGPDKDCKIGPPAPAITLFGLTSIMEATPKAEKAWREAPWTK
jgi:hypothetical protein